MTRALGCLSPVALGRPPHVGTRTAVGFEGLRERVLIEHLPPVYDQGGVGSCTAQALACAIEALLPRAGYAPERPDRAALYRREREMIGRPTIDSGAIIADGVAVLHQGWEREAVDPSGTWGDIWTRPRPVQRADAPRLVSSEPLDFDDATIATELDAGHPVVVGLQVTTDWQGFAGDVLPEPAGEVIGGHAVLLVGYDLTLRCWRVRNSWGESWGDGGEAWLPWAWTRAPWCTEAFALRAVRRAEGVPTPAGDEPETRPDRSPTPVLALAATQPVTPARVLAPGVGATFYGKLPRDLDSARGREVIRACDLVTLHTLADPTDVRSAALVRQLGCARVWLGLPANYLSRMDLERGRAAVLREVERIARVAVDMGAECVELNGEGASNGRTPGDWTSATDDPAEDTRLESLGRDVMLALRAALDAIGGAHIAIAWTSHDGTGFRVPRSVLSRVDLHTPQHYPAQAGRVVRQRELERRVAWSRGQWEALARRGAIPADVAPGGARWSPYFQGHGHAIGALVWGLCEAPIARLWACPNSWSVEAVDALRLARTLRARAGHGSDAVERFQLSMGLEPDGAVGPRTLSALQGQ